MAPPALEAFFQWLDIYIFALSTILEQGCSQAPGEHAPAPGPGAAARHEDEQFESHFDFGAVVSDGTPLTHDFSVTNRGAKTIRILNAAALTPCCSSIGALPQSLEPGEACRIPVVLKTGSQTTTKHVAFVVKTDHKTTPIWRYSVSARLLAARELRDLGGSKHVVTVGEPGVVDMGLACRAASPSTDEFPAAILTSNKISVGFLGEISMEPGKTATEFSRVVRINVLESGEVGTHREDVVFRWRDGREWKYPFVWEVAPNLQAFPAGLILSRSDAPIEKIVTIRARGEPFRILDVRGRCVASCKFDRDVDRQAHEVLLKLKTDTYEPEEVGHVEISTSDSSQPVVKLSVMAVGSPGY